MADHQLANITDAPSAVSVSRNEFQTMREQAADLIASGYLPKAIDKPEKAVAIIMLGRELGMGPWQSFNSIDVIQGRPTLKPVGMAALVNRFVDTRGGYMRVVESTAQRCTIEYLRPPAPQARSVSFTIDEAKQAGLLGKDTWKQYPADMLRNRAIARACREAFSDVIIGLYTDEEVSSIADEPRAPRGTTTNVRAIHTEPIAQPDEDAFDVESRPVEEDRDKANRKFFAVMASRGFTDEANKLFALAHYRKRGDQLTTSRKQLTANELTNLVTIVEDNIPQVYDDNGEAIPVATPDVEIANLIAAAPDHVQLDLIRTRMKANGHGADWLTKMWRKRYTQVPAVDEQLSEVVAW